MQEHAELVSLFIHEDSLAWQLTVGLIAANAATITGTYGLGVFDESKKLELGAVALLVVGCFLNLVGFFVLQRSKIHRSSRLYRAIHVEAELDRLGIKLQTFGSGEGAILKGFSLTMDSDAPRRLGWWERIEVLDAHYLFNVLAVALLALTIWAILGRPGHW